ncbi:MAG: 2Fe-2S iron-sulfur cluster-binding protein [Hyphomicrobiales bacterium]
MRVIFQKSGRGADWDPNSYSLLEFAEEQGLNPAFSCRAGICSTCKTQLVSGEVGYFEEPLEDLEDGAALLCCSKPLTDVVLDM